MNRKGFTLVEVLVVVLIIGILTTVALPQYQKAIERSRSAAAITALGNLARGEKAYQVLRNTFTDDLGLLDLDLPGTYDDDRRGFQMDHFYVRISAVTASTLLAFAERTDQSADKTYGIALGLRSNGTTVKWCFPGNRESFEGEGYLERTSKGVLKVPATDAAVPAWVGAEESMRFCKAIAEGEEHNIIK